MHTYYTISLHIPRKKHVLHNSSAHIKHLSPEKPNEMNADLDVCSIRPPRVFQLARFGPRCPHSSNMKQECHYTHAQLHAHRHPQPEDQRPRRAALPPELYPCNHVPSVRRHRQMNDADIVPDTGAKPTDHFGCA